MGFIDTLCSFLGKGTGTISRSTGSLGSVIGMLAGGRAGSSVFGGSSMGGSAIGGILGGVLGGSVASGLGRGGSRNMNSTLNNVINKFTRGGNQSQQPNSYQQGNYQQNNYQTSQPGRQNAYNAADAAYQAPNQFQQNNSQSQPYNNYSLETLLRTDEQKSDFILLIVQIGSYVARCDEQFTLDEQQKIGEFVTRISSLSNMDNSFRQQIDEIMNTSYTLDQLGSSMDYVLNCYNNDAERHMIMNCVDEFIKEIASVDSNVSDSERNFYNTWHQRYQ